MKEWFARWYEQKRNIDTTECRELLYPCYTFDHAKGFAAMTKQLAYDFSGHIEEQRPEGVGASQREHRLPNNQIIGECKCRLYLYSANQTKRCTQRRRKQPQNQTPHVPLWPSCWPPQGRDLYAQGACLVGIPSRPDEDRGLAFRDRREQALNQRASRPSRQIQLHRPTFVRQLPFF